MSNLSNADKQYLDNALRLETGFIVRFNKETFSEFFQNFDIDIYDDKYSINGNTKTNRIHAFWEIEDNNLVAMSLFELSALFRNRELAMPMNVKFSIEIEKIANKLLLYPIQNKEKNDVMRKNQQKSDNCESTIEIKA